jgi:hypothetical protein
MKVLSKWARQIKPMRKRTLRASRESPFNEATFSYAATARRISSTGLLREKMPNIELLTISVDL